MNRRHFVRNALITGAALPLKTESMDTSAASKQQWYELRTYTFADDSQRQLTSAYLEKALIPALNRAGHTHIGVFFEQPQPTATAEPIGQPHTFLLIPFDSIESFAVINEKLARDKTYTEAAGNYLNGLILPEPAAPATASATAAATAPAAASATAPAIAPAYQRIESSLLKAFAHMPILEAPAQKPRLFELRRYESPTETAGQKKIEMFNDAGEIDIFKKIGARPVFFGETIIGQYRPNLTYLLTFDDMPDHDARWKAFGSDPDWKLISKKPEYADALLISKITRTFLSPAPYSQI